MNKQVKTGIIVLVAPFASFLISFLGTALISSIDPINISIGNIEISPFAILFGALGTISVIGMLICPIIGIVLIATSKKKEEVVIPVQSSPAQANPVQEPPVTSVPQQ